MPKDIGKKTLEPEEQRALPERAPGAYGLSEGWQFRIVKPSRCVRRYRAKETDDGLMPAKLRQLANLEPCWCYGKPRKYLKLQVCPSSHVCIYRHSG